MQIATVVLKMKVAMIKEMAMCSLRCLLSSSAGADATKEL
jgi:hypothetical protein